MAGDDGRLLQKVFAKRMSRALGVLVVGGFVWFLCAAVVDNAQQEANFRAREAAQKQLYAGVQQAEKTLSSGRFDAAETTLQELVASELDGAAGTRSRLLLGKALWAKGDRSGAEAVFTELQREHPNSVDGSMATHKLGWIALIRGDRREAAVHWGKVGGSAKPLWPEGRALAAWVKGDPPTSGFGEPTGIPTRRFKSAKEQLLSRNPMAVGSFREIRKNGQTGKRVPHTPQVQRSRGGFFVGKALLGNLNVDEAGSVWEEVGAEDPGGEWGGRARFKASVLRLMTGDVDGAKAGFAAVNSGFLRPEAVALHRWLETDPELPAPLR